MITQIITIGTDRNERDIVDSLVNVVSFDNQVNHHYHGYPSFPSTERGGANIP